MFSQRKTSQQPGCRGCGLRQRCSWELVCRRTISFPKAQEGVLESKKDFRKGLWARVLLGGVWECQPVRGTGRSRAGWPRVCILYVSGPEQKAATRLWGWNSTLCNGAFARGRVLIVSAGEGNTQRLRLFSCVSQPRAHVVHRLFPHRDPCPSKPTALPTAQDHQRGCCHQQGHRNIYRNIFLSTWNTQGV